MRRTAMFSALLALAIGCGDATTDDALTRLTVGNLPEASTLNYRVVCGIDPDCDRPEIGPCDFEAEGQCPFDADRCSLDLALPAGSCWARFAPRGEQGESFCGRSERFDLEAPGSADLEFILECEFADAPPQCVDDCGGCNEGEICVTQATFGRVLPTCVALCQDDRTCEEGERCFGGQLGAGSEAGPRGICVSETSPAICDRRPLVGAHCDFFGPRALCETPEVLLEDIPVFGMFCGTSYTFCENGCLDGACR